MLVSFRSLIAAAAGLCLASCVFLPVPEHGTLGTRYVGADAQEKLLPGRTTRTDVLMMLGEPDSRDADHRSFEYHWEANVAFFGVGYGYSGAGGMITRPRRLCLDFDAAGVLAAKRLLGQGIFSKSNMSCAIAAEEAEKK